MTPFVRPEDQLVVEVFVRDLSRSVDFYSRLGFELKRREDHFAELVWEGHLFFLDERPEVIETSTFPQANVRIMVPDVDRYWDLARTMNARIVLPLADRYYGLRDFIMADPDGFGLRFATPLKVEG